MERIVAIIKDGFYTKTFSRWQQAVAIQTAMN